MNTKALIWSYMICIVQGRIQDFGKGDPGNCLVLKHSVFAHTHITFFPSLRSLGVPQKEGGGVLNPRNSPPGSSPLIQYCNCLSYKELCLIAAHWSETPYLSLRNSIKQEQWSRGSVLASRSADCPGATLVPLNVLSSSVRLTALLKASPSHTMPM